VRFAPEAEQLSSAYDLTIFVNNTIVGSRLYSHRIEIGGLGDVFSSDTFATTTYDKDGQLSFTSPSTTVEGDDVFDAYPGKFNTLVAT
jgi:hypothetical protein